MTLKSYLKILNDEDKKVVKRTNKSEDVLDQADTISLEDLRRVEDAAAGDEDYN